MNKINDSEKMEVTAEKPSTTHILNLYGSIYTILYIEVCNI